MRITEGSFWDHLEELRKRLFVIIAAVVCGTAGSFFVSRRLMALILVTGPATLQALSPSEAIVAHMKISLIAGILISSPVLFYQFWVFVSPGLFRGERKAMVGITISSALLFTAGAVFAWLVMLQPALDLFRSFETGEIVGHWSLSSYVGFLGRFVLVFGLAFQMPLLVLGLTRLGIISPRDLGKYRRHVIIGLLIISALLTPPDPVTQVLLALPLYLLFELSLLLAVVTSRKREKIPTEERD